MLIEGTPRYEFRFLRNLLARAGGDPKKSAIEVRILLLEADKDAAKSDGLALSEFPTRDELKKYDVIILGDVDLAAIGKEKLTWVADLVKENGAGLLLIAGQQFSPQAYKVTPLADLLPVEPADRAKEPDKERDAFRLEATAAGKKSLFRLHKEDKENETILKGLAAMHWFAEGYKPRRRRTCWPSIPA